MATRRSLRIRQRGSVYIITLLVLLILTVVGLTVASITQSEMQIGVNERLSQAAFYSANSGIDIATAKALVVPDLRSFEIDLVEPANLANLNIRHRLEVSPFQPILRAPCNLCQINPDSPFFKINHAVASQSTRIAWMGPPNAVPPNPTPLAQKRLSVMVSFEPWNTDTTAAADAAQDSNKGGLADGF